ncbi:cobyrinate a,c-diamide synthase [Pseudooceanicola sp. C21-150M6]|uniref:cobyrinate a,c-diamide synthase n=1 Tax=Pseudooceanicola sp. C21-150M6 TaxID=3434355 RepID=UPI003D7F71B9
MKGLILAAPASGSGKTTVTLALLRALARAGIGIRAAKSGPDYIDPRFHEAACGQPCVNLDAWAMSPARLRALAAGDLPLIIEGAMGLFDGAPPDGKGAVADLARLLGLPVVLVVDAGKMAQSVAPLVAGFAHHDPEVKVAGVILNNVGSARHYDMLTRALAPTGLPVLAAMPRRADLALPSRHLGLVQAAETGALDDYLDHAAAILAAGVPDRPNPPLSDILDLATRLLPAPQAPRIAPPAQRIAVAYDEAFAFAYPHMLEDWHAQGAELSTFSPLNDDPVPQTDFVFLPGGYPELHAGRIANAATFLKSLQRHAETRGIYGECGGYMVLGASLTDAEGVPHRMAGLLPLATSFKKRQLHLGYRTVTADHGPFPGTHKAHEFHYATTLYTSGAHLFDAEDAEGHALPPMGLIEGRVAGSFAHIIDRA